MSNSQINYSVMVHYVSNYSGHSTNLGYICLGNTLYLDNTIKEWQMITDELVIIEFIISYFNAMPTIVIFNTLTKISF